IERGTGLLIEHGAGVCMRIRLTVTAIARECVVHIRYADNARRQRNVAARKAIGIALAVPTLVVTADHRADVERELEACDNVVAGHGVPPHHLPLTLIEAACLRE